MLWEQLITSLRFGQEHYQRSANTDVRSEFQRDFDRLIFSAPFRRLQNKTQVFPLPGSVFVHNRLTHSLEVSCVGRSLSDGVGEVLKSRHPENSHLFDALGAIVSSACLAHDMGNPPFGHSGEKAIETYFSEGKGIRLQEQLTAQQWTDCTHFEGNANAFRLLTHQFAGRREGGFVLTYSTLASIVKYPFSSHDAPKNKFGFFADDEASYLRIAEKLGIPALATDKTIFARYPLVYLVEAADDICYQIMDIEDAHKLRILTTDETKSLLLGFFDAERREHILSRMSTISDVNEQIAYLRSCAIGTLVDACKEVFLDNERNILDGTFSGALIKHIDPLRREAYDICAKLAVKKIYRSGEVLDVELAGYKIIYILMEELMEAVLNPDKAYSRQLLQRIPQQYEIGRETIYGKCLAILDYIAGMTDVYALDLYQKITGMSLPKV